MTNQPDLITQLIAIRKSRGLSQREVARRMYVTPPLISMFENGKRPMHTNHLLAYAQAIGARITVEDSQ